MSRLRHFFCRHEWEESEVWSVLSTEVALQNGIFDTEIKAKQCKRCGKVEEVGQ